MLGRIACSLSAASLLLLTTPADAGLVGHYTLDETSGTTAADSAAPANNGTISGTVNLGVAGKVGTAFDFAGGIVEVNGGTGALGIDGNKARSFSLWFNADAIGQQDRLLSSGVNAGGQQFDLVVANDESEGDSLRLHYGNGNRAWSGITTGTWTHVALTYSGSGDGTGTSFHDGLKLYINGVEQTADGGNNNNAQQALNTTATADFRIGRGGSGFNPFNGRIDEVRIYNDVLTQQEITALAVPEPGSLALLGLGGLLVARRRRD